MSNCAVLTPIKVCATCKQKFPATTEYFYKRAASPGGLQSQCKKCIKAWKRSSAGKKSQKKSNQSPGHKVSAKKYRQTHKIETAERNWARRQTIVGHLRDVFSNMKKRCYDPNDRNYKYYGGRGIKVCFTSDEFVHYVVDDLQEDPIGLTIDRIDNDGNYERGNIRFVSQAVNNQNRRSYKKKKKK